MDSTTRQALEAVLFVADEPVPVPALSQILEVGTTELEAELAMLATRLEEERRGFVLRHVAGGWRFYTAPEVAAHVERWVVAGRSARLSQAALETLAVIAYKQPISRGEINEVRGVNADAAVRTLLARGFITEVGRESGPGQAVLYGTTASFLEKLGVDSLEDLPPLSDFLVGAAPDEPGPDQLRAARAHLREGRELPSTGRPRWDPEGALDTQAGEDPGDDRQPAAAGQGSPLADGAEGGGDVPEGAGRLQRREREQELDSLTEALERAARNAMAALEGVVRAGEASEAPSDDAEDEA